MANEVNEVLRQLPAVGEVLARADVKGLVGTYSQEAVTEAARVVVAGLRRQMLAGEVDAAGLAGCMDGAGALVERELRGRLRPRLRRVVNATGVILQTNLGRAPLGEAALARVMEVGRGYSNLEFDLERGERGRRDALVEELILEVLGVGGAVARKGQARAFGARAAKYGGPSAPLRFAQDDGVQVWVAPDYGSQGALKWAAVVVNNCAAATFLVLNTLAAGGEVVVSRGELVEIGGGFRVPEILEKSGAVLREVGTTNKTRVGDYAGVIGPATRLILRVHRSNFEIRGFTEQPSVEELVELGRRSGVPVFEDQGTGCLVDLGEVGLVGEGSLRGSVRSGVDLVAASGDKLLGGPQCGLLVGRTELIERVRANPLFRALRVDKLTYAALEGTLLAYVAGREEELPVVRMLRMPAEAVRRRCERWVSALAGAGVRARVEAEVVEVRSVVGGGTTPGASLASFAVSLRVEGMSEAGLAAELRALEPAVVGRVSEGRVLLDLRTVGEWEDDEVLGVLRRALGGGGSGGSGL